MKFTASTGSNGKWLDKKSLKNGDVIKLVTEAIEIDGLNGKQIVAKARVKGKEGEAENVSINKPSKNALIEAFGADSKEWVNKHLTVNVEKTNVGGKRGIALYLIPEGYAVTEDGEGFIIVARQEAKYPNSFTSAKEQSTVEYPSEDIDPSDIPF